MMRSEGREGVVRDGVFHGMIRLVVKLFWLSPPDSGKEVDVWEEVRMDRERGGWYGQEIRESQNK